MNLTGILELLESSQNQLRGVIEHADESGYRGHFHPDLSPIGWHLGHCAFIELYWLQEVIMEDDSSTAPLHTTYFPELAPPKPERGRLLPLRNELLEWAADLHAWSRSLFARREQTLPNHNLLENDYLQKFLIQHNCQHLETMRMALVQNLLREDCNGFRSDGRLAPAAQYMDAVAVAGGGYHVGSPADIAAYDNEQPMHEVELDAFSIARNPVSNAQYLAFMDAGGYDEQAFWSHEGWVWMRQHAVTHPDHWRRDKGGNWYGIGTSGPFSLDPDLPVCGVSHHEACAFTAWASQHAGSRCAAVSLPHEHQWEVACRLGKLERTGWVWEWCANPLHPYRGFHPFPYERYSMPWFDGQHYVLRGGSIHTQEPVRRPGFRNFFNPDKRHIFAGMRLLYRH